MNLFTRILVAILLRRKQQFIKVIRVGNRNVLVQIEEYTPATELLKKCADKL